jgi:hypothetical protein
MATIGSGQSQTILQGQSDSGDICERRDQGLAFNIGTTISPERG